MKIWRVIALIFLAASTSHAQTLPTVNDPELSAYLTRRANDITARTNHPLTCTVTVLASDSSNAYALPNGEVYVTRGLVRAVANEAEIVFVLAQQLSLLSPNNRAPTNTAQAQRPPPAGHTILVGLISGALIAFGGPAGAEVGALVLAQELRHRARLRYGSWQSAPASLITEADKLAVEYLHEAGYDPEAAVSLLEKLRTLRPQNYVRQSELPPSPVTFRERLRLVRTRLVKLERKPAYLLDSSAFKALKDQLPPSPKHPNLTSSSQRR